MPLPSYVPSRRGFTLLEMILVLVIIAILAGVTMPAFDSAVNEHRIREDGHQLAMMVRTAMIQSNEQHRPYEIELTKSSMSLHPLGELVHEADNPDATLFKDSGSTSATTNADQPIEESVTQDVDVEQQLDSANKLQVPDVTKTNGWIDMPADGTQWVFQPGELCPAASIRIARGDAYLEMDFEALTGNVAGEKSYFP
jgi:prepilin-type N-terminal cleavage/methylation domain-containing protein